MKQKNEQNIASDENLVSLASSNWEQIFVCTLNKKKSNDDEAVQNVLSDIKLLDFVNNPCDDVSDDINYNDGKAANQFDKISKYYGRKKNVFLFNLMLKNEEWFNKILSIITKKCDSTARENFINRMNIYLERIKQGEEDAKEFLKSEEFPGAFFNGYPQNRHENLNVNFTNCTQCLEISKIFCEKLKRMEEMKSETRRVKVYDNGKRVVTINKKSDRRLNYSFTDDSSCQLIVYRVLEGENYSLSIDINSDDIIHIDLEINGSKAEPQKVLKLPSTDEVIYINGKNLFQVLRNYFDEEAKIKPTLSPENECLPIKILEDLKTWCPPLKKTLTEKLVKRKEAKDEPKTLICHDMKGGYLEDRFIEGSNCEDPYFFVHWTGVDIFVYFSHHLVTIPPPGWISAAHKNGVKVLGTFITEWNDGAKVCEDVFSNEKSTQQLCKQLVNIAFHYNFDGWLINIENPIKPCQIPKMRKFLKCLTERMHMVCPGSQVIWYDSVIKNGDLKWQNALNNLNRMFFHGCDGIFLNYNWTSDHLMQSLSEAGSRKTDVYVGVDVFGRGCLGGGGFSTDIAVTEARKFGLSVAIFAPGWVYECLDIEDFQENQFKFWNALEKFLPSRIIQELPYHSSFCPGFGKKMFREGEIISDKSWYNLSLQQSQPIYKKHSTESAGSVSLCTAEGYNGGGCLLLTGDFHDKSVPLNFKILETFFQLETTCIIKLVFKPLSCYSEIILSLNMSSNQEDYCLNLVESGKSQIYKSANISTRYLNEAMCFDEATGNVYKPKEAFLKTKTKELWITRKFVLPVETFAGHIVKEVSIKLVSTDFEKDLHAIVLIGELQILPQKN